MASPKRSGIRVLIVDDQRTFAEALRIAIDSAGGLTVIGIAGDGEEAIQLTRSLRPDVVLMDIEMPGVDGIEATRRLKDLRSEAQIIILSAHQNETMLARAVEAGAVGYLSKAGAVTSVADAIRRAASGQPLIDLSEVRRILSLLEPEREGQREAESRVQRLTPRELEILQLMADGMTSERIATTLHVSPHTLRTHIQNILTKLQVHSKLEALTVAIRFGRVVVSGPSRTS